MGYRTSPGISYPPVSHHPINAGAHILREDSEDTYRRIPSLAKPENNILLVLTWSSTLHTNSLEVLSCWTRSEESLYLYQRLISKLRLSQAPEEFALTLAALLGRERLLPYTISDSARPIRGSYLADLDAILDGQDIKSKREVFEQMCISLLRMLYMSVNTNEDILRLLAEAIVEDPPLRKSLDGRDQYCAGKLRGHNHGEAFEKAREELSKSKGAKMESMEANMKNMEANMKNMEAMMTSMGPDAEWTVIPDADAEGTVTSTSKAVQRIV